MSHDNPSSVERHDMSGHVFQINLFSVVRSRHHRQCVPLGRWLLITTLVVWTCASLLHMSHSRMSHDTRYTLHHLVVFTLAAELVGILFTTMWFRLLLPITAQKAHRREVVQSKFTVPFQAQSKRGKSMEALLPFH